MRSSFTATLILLALVSLTLPARAQSTRPQQQPVIEVAFVLDTTGSMSGLIEGAKQKIWSIASKIATGQPTPKLRVGLVGYRDKGDRYVTRTFDLTDDLDAIYEHLQAFQADGGGDTPEHVGRALGEAVKTFSWSRSNRVMKTIFLVGDAPPQTYKDGWNYETWAKKAIAKGIVVNTVRCGNMAETAGPFQRIAHLADGSFTSIDASGGMVAVATPFDDKIEELNREMASTALYGGRTRSRRVAQKKAAKIGEMKGEAAASRVDYGYAALGQAAKPMVLSAKAAGDAKDLVATPSALASMDDDELPEALRGMNERERKAHIASLAKKRESLNDRLQSLSARRSDFIAKTASKKADSFDAQVLKQIKAQGAKHGVRF
jgi:hypothetical protein